MKWIALPVALLLLAAVTAARSGVPEGRHSVHTEDTLPSSPLPARLAGYDSVFSTPRNDRFYDTLHSRYTRRALPRFIYHSLFAGKRTDMVVGGNVMDETKLFAQYEGRQIARIDLVRVGIMGSDSTRIERWANDLHTTTRAVTIRRDLLFRQGDLLDPEILVKSQQRLRARRYISDVGTTVAPDPDDPQKVVVTVYTKDNWSISGDAEFDTDGRTMFKIYDANILGYGCRLSLATNFDWSGWSYGGTQAELDIPNIGGTPFEVHLEAGKRFEDSNLGLDISKEFLLPTDYAAGASYFDKADLTYMLYADSSMQIKSRVGDVWSGRSIFIPALRSSIYLTGRYSSSRYDKRPPVSRTLNPAFHDEDFVIGALGFYRERFYTANLIYGYGLREYLASGFRVEGTLGYSRREFQNQWYGGLSYRMGGFGTLGYLMGSVSVGNYFSPGTDEAWGAGALLVESSYFTNLLRVGPRTRLRQFVNVSWMQGWNRGQGSDEVVGFRDQYRLRALNVHLTGVNRANLSVESVIFTPWQPLGFRLAAFTYVDMGVLGYDPNIFHNPFYSTIGVGVRLKNERLVFNAIEIRLGVAIGKNGFMNSEYFTLTNQNRINQPRFKPSAPQILPMR